MKAIEVKNISKEYVIFQDKNKCLNDKIGQKRLFNMRNIKKHIKKKFLALNNVNFKVDRGEILGVIGENGAGKSTLLKILSRITPPSSGKIKIIGRTTSLLEVGTGFNSELSGRDNIYLNGAILGMKKSEIDSSIDQIIDFSGIDEFIETPVKRYSSGMRVRLGFSVAAFLNFDVLLIDEVLAVGDINFQRKSLDKMEEIVREKGKTILFVSHNMSAINNLCSRALLLEKGSVLCDGKVDKVISEYYSKIDYLNNDNITTRKDRRGAGMCKIKNFKVKNSNGDKYLSSGDKVNFNIEYRNDFKKKINEVKVFIRILSNLGEPLLTFKNFYNNNNFTDLGKKGKITCIIKKFPLKVGKYYVDLAIRINDELQDDIKRAGSFQVDFANFYESKYEDKNAKLGYFLTDNNWDLEKYE
ncbi:MAG: ABC transporter ATP-binding protein [Patescibacteria group bacterium]|nr:ABC transporter ATP-binding protein [Patescibacteria group bacterium]